MDTMRAVRLLEPGRFELATVPVPEPAAGEVRVAVRACGVCGSDVHLVDGVTAARCPVVLGHEAAGTVAAVGSGVDGVEVGARVTVLPYVGCGRCGRCAADEPHACASRLVLGVDRAGAQADFVTVPAGCVVPLPDAVSIEIGAILSDAVATPYHAIRRSGASPGDTAVVFGAGGLGSHAIQLLAGVFGCRVIAVDRRQAALDHAAELGATPVRATDVRADVDEVLRIAGGGADVAFEFVGYPEIVGTALRCLRPQGTCVVVGIGPDRLSLGLRQETLVARELRLLGSFGCTASELAELVDLVATGRLDLAGSVGREYAPEQFAEALAETRNKDTGSVRVVVGYR